MAEGQGSGSGWLKGCAIGCAIIVLIGIAAIVGVYFFARSAIQQGAAQTQAQAQQKYEQVMPGLEAGDLDLSSLEEIHQHSQRDDVGSTASMISSGFLLGVLEDESVSEQEAEAADTLAGLLRENPDPGLMQAAQWIDSHPELERFLNDLPMQGQGAPFDASGMDSQDAPTEEEAPAPAPAPEQPQEAPAP